MRVIRRDKESIATGWVVANFPDSQSGVVAGLGASFFVKATYRLRPGEVPIPWSDEPVTGCGDGQWRRHRWPWLPEKFDYTFFNAAPPDQWIDGFFRGDESLAFENMHPEQAVFTTRLPGMRARCFVTKRQADDDSRPAVFCEVPL